jgi:imidazolonepropionase-like amidohydrolase
MKKIQMVSCLLLGTLLANAGATDTLSYSVILGGNIKGYSKTWQQADGSWRTNYQFNDRGRGDSTVTIYRENEKGLLTSLQISGVDYLKAPFVESFAMTNGIARWKNPSEQEERKVNNPAFYLGLKGGAGNLAKAIFNYGGTLDLLPVGQAKASIILTDNFGAAGQSKRLSLVAIEGMGFTPNYVWVDESNIDFAYVSDWVSTIATGSESLTSTLLDRQKQIESALFVSIAKKYSQEPPGGICFQKVNYFDAEKGRLVRNANVFVENGIISKISFDKKPAIKEAMLLVDGRGKTLLPGLWDMHTHPSSDLDGILHIAAGITNIRDMGSGPDLLERSAAFESGKVIGPDITVKSGFIDGAGPFAAPTGKLINNVEEGKQFIKEYADLGYQQIKLYSSIKPEWVKPLIDEAKKYKMRVCGHIPAFMTASQAIDAGYNEITHTNMLVLNFFGDTVDTRSPLRFKLPAAKTASLDLNGPEMKKFIKQMQDKHIAVDPTINVFEEMFLGRDGVMSAAWKGVVNRFPAQAQRNMRAGGGGLPVPEGMDETYRKSFDAMLRIVKLLHDSKIPIVSGTDAFAGFMLHWELELYAQAGIPNAAVLQIATIGSARVAGADKTNGSIAEGKQANLVLIDGNPLENISDIRRAVMTVKGVKLFDNAALYNSISIKGYNQ